MAINIRWPWSRTPPPSVRPTGRAYQKIEQARLTSNPTPAQKKLLAYAKDAYDASWGTQKKKLGQALGIGGGKVEKTRRQWQKGMGYEQLEKIEATQKPKYSVTCLP